MAVFRVNKDKENPYVMLNKHFIYDARLSLKSKGLMAYFLSRPDDWKFYQSEILQNCKDKKDSLLSTIKELQEHGYIKRRLMRDEKGKLLGGYEYEVFEIPNNLTEGGKTDIGKTETGENRKRIKPNSENPPLLNNESLLNNDFKVINEFNNKKKEIENPLIVYQNNIFPTPGAIDIETINNWTEKLGADIVIYSINIAAKANARKLNYIEKILMDWERQGITTLEQAEAYTANRSKKKTKS
ncbi:replication initiation and membrane attachment, partial [Clostridium botulinum C/D str. DC5]